MKYNNNINFKEVFLINICNQLLYKKNINLIKINLFLIVGISKFVIKIKEFL